MLIKEKELKKFFNLSYGEKAPSREEWESLYNKQVKFIDPTQEKNGIDAYIKAQDGLIKSCLLYTSPSPRDRQKSRMPSSA